MIVQRIIECKLSTPRQTPRKADAAREDFNRIILIASKTQQSIVSERTAVGPAMHVQVSSFRCVAVECPGKGLDPSGAGEILPDP